MGRMESKAGISKQCSVASIRYIGFRILLKAEGGVFVEEEDEPNGKKDEGEDQEEGEHRMIQDGGVFQAAAEDDGDEPKNSG